MLSGILAPTHLIVILVVALLVLGPKRLPDAGRALGQGLREFRSSFGGANDEAPPRLEPAADPRREESTSADTSS
jgi:sec-independent protein translocase protein TatA